MSSLDNAIERRGITRATLGPGVVLGALGILGFSFSFPATRLAVADLDPWLVAFGRATGAAVLAAVYLRATRAPRPTRAQVRSLAIVALGVVVGFPLFSSLAPQSEPGAPGGRARGARGRGARRRPRGAPAPAGRGGGGGGAAGGGPAGGAVLAGERRRTRR